MKTESKHTPGPWKYHYTDSDESRCGYLITNHSGLWPVAFVSSANQNLGREANAAFIVEACNNYDRIKAERDELAAAARDLLGVIDAHNRPASCSYDFYYSSGALRAALAKLDKEEVIK